MPDLKENSRTALAFATGVLAWLAFPSVGVWPLAFVAWVPLFVALDGVTARRGLALGWVAGVTMTALGFSFLETTLVRYSGFSTPVCWVLYAMLTAYQGLRVGALGFLAARGIEHGYPRLPILAIAFVTTELCFPLPFPWTFGASVHHVLPMAQVADLGGPIAVSAVVVAFNAGIAELVGRSMAPICGLRPRVAPAPRSLLAAFAAMSVPLIALVYGMFRMRAVDREIDRADSVVVGIVQPNLALRTRDEGSRRGVAMTRDLADRGAGFVVWSEAALGGPFPEEGLGSLVRATVTSRLGVSSVIGLTVEDTTSPRSRIFNAAITADADGEVRGRYDKRHLVPFGEYLPYAEDWPALRALSPASGDFSAGARRADLRIAGHRVAATICYEDILSGYVRDLAAESDPELIVNLTNDGWFAGSNEPAVHLALARLRSIEHRRFLVRATNSGASTLVDPVGRLVLTLPTDVESSALGEARWMQMHTIYDRIGDVFWYVCALFAIGAALLPRGVTSRRSGSGPSRRGSPKA